MTRSVTDILISTIRAQAETTRLYDEVRTSGADEFTIARFRREMLSAASVALATADMAERVEQRCLARAEIILASLRLEHLTTSTRAEPTSVA